MLTDITHSSKHASMLAVSYGHDQMEFCSRISKTRPDDSISPLFGHEGHMGFINWAKLSLLAHVAQDEEDVKKETARIPGSGFRRIKKKKKKRD